MPAGRAGQKAKTAVLKAVTAQNAAVRPQIAQHIKKSSRLFVFVDDLDRCTPDGCVMVLEAVNPARANSRPLDPKRQR